MLLCKSLFYIFVLTTEILCDCRKSAITVCDNFEDVKKFKGIESVTDLMIGSENGSTNMTSIELMNQILLVPYRKLTTLMVVRAVNKLTPSPFRCTYYKYSLKYLHFYGNNLEVIEKSSFPEISLKRLSLTNNNIRTIEKRALNNVPAEEVDLSDNFLELIEADTLPNRIEVKKISLQNNRITHIEPDSFTTSLESLNLHNNTLRYLQKEVFEKLVNLKELILTHNDFHILPNVINLKSLIVLDVSHNAISNIEKGTCKNMKNLQLLDFSNNKIEDGTVLEWIFTPKLQANLIVNLAYNYLNFLNIEDVDLESQTLILHGNPWNCDFWDTLQKNISEHLSECDLQFLATGKVPFCFIQTSSTVFKDKKWYKDVENYHNIVKSGEEEAYCDLVPKKFNNELYPEGYACHGPRN